MGPAASARVTEPDAAAVPAVATCLQKGRQVSTLACLSFRRPLSLSSAPLLPVPPAWKELADLFPASGDLSLLSRETALSPAGIAMATRRALPANPLRDDLSCRFRFEADRLCRSSFWHREFQHAVLKHGAHLFCIHLHWQIDDAQDTFRSAF